MKDNTIEYISIASLISKRFAGDEVVVLQAYAMQVMPLIDLQLNRIRDGLKELDALGDSVETTLKMINVLGDVRFYYEALYWLALALEESGTSCLSINDKSPLGLIYQNEMKPLINKMKAPRIALSHIHFDQLIRAESSKKLEGERIQKHLPKDGKLMFKLTFNVDKTGITIGNQSFNFDNDYNNFIEIKKILAGHYQK